VADPASRAGVSYNHWDSILGLHRAGDRTALDADAAKRSVGEAESPLNDSDTVLWFWGSGGRGRRAGSANGCFNDSLGGFGGSTKSSSEEGEQTASGKAGTHLVVAVLNAVVSGGRSLPDLGAGRSLAAEEKAC